MDDIGTVVRLRREALKMSQEALAEKVGCTQATIDKIEHGRSRKSKYLADVLMALGLPLSNLPAPEVAPSPVQFRPSKGPSPMTSVYGVAQGGPHGRIQLSNDPVGYISTPHPLTNVDGGYAVIVSGESMVPRFQPGELALVHPTRKPRPGMDVILYADRDGESDVIIKRLVAEKPTMWIVEQFNPKRTIELSRDEWTRCHVVVGNYGQW